MLSSCTAPVNLGHKSSKLNQELLVKFNGGSTVDTDEVDSEDAEPRIVTTEEELEGFFTVKSIVRDVVDPERIVHRDTISYMTVVLDNSRAKQICRLYFNRPTKFLGFVNEDGQRERVQIDSLDDIYNYAERLKAIAQDYAKPPDAKIPEAEE